METAKKNRRYMMDGSARSDAACAIAERLGTGTYTLGQFYDAVFRGACTAVMTDYRKTVRQILQAYKGERRGTMLFSVDRVGPALYSITCTPAAGI